MGDGEEFVDGTLEETAWAVFRGESEKRTKEMRQMSENWLVKCMAPRTPTRLATSVWRV